MISIENLTNWLRHFLTQSEFSDTIPEEYLFGGTKMRKLKTALKIIGVVLIVLNCIPMIMNPSLIPETIRATGALIPTLIGLFSISIIGLVLIIISCVIRPTNK